MQHQTKNRSSIIIVFIFVKKIKLYQYVLQKLSRILKLLIVSAALVKDNKESLKKFKEEYYPKTLNDLDSLSLSKILFFLLYFIVASGSDIKSFIGLTLIGIFLGEYSLIIIFATINYIISIIINGLNIN